MRSSRSQFDWLTIRLFFPLILLAGSVRLCAETVPIPAAPTQWVTDTAGFLSPDAVRTLDARLKAYEQISGHQLIVYIAPSSGDAPIEDWAVRAFKQWKIGRKGLDDGLALFIMARDHKLRIEVGYGLEPVVPDAIASRVIREVMAPRIEKGDHDGAVTAAIDSITGVIGGQASALPVSPDRGQANTTQRQPMQGQALSLWQMILFGIVGVVVLIFLITHPSLAFFFLSSMMSGGGGGGGGGFGGGGGGFSGGGGRSGGGGASGSW